MLDKPDYAPRGYQAFKVETQGRKGWVLATPHCDDAEALVAEVWVPAEAGGDFVPFLEFKDNAPQYHERERYPVLFETKEEAIVGAWEHAKIWWGGEPPDSKAIPFYHLGSMPPGYDIFIEVAQRRMWLMRPDGSMTGEISGVTLSAALQCYEKVAREEQHEKFDEKRQDDRVERIRAWAENDPTDWESPRKWESDGGNHGDFSPSLPKGHYDEVRMYLPFETTADLHLLRDRGNTAWHFKVWIEEGIQRAAKKKLGESE